MSRFITTLALIFSAAAAFADVPWHTKLELANGELWQKRIPLTIQNDSDQPLGGEVIELKIGKNPGQVDLAGAQAHEIRVCTADGTELLWHVVGPDRKTVARGPIPAGSTLLVPAQCGARSSETLCIYFENASAWPVPDFLDTKGPRAKLKPAIGAVESLPLQRLPRPRPVHGGAFWETFPQVPNFEESPLRTLVLVDLSAMFAQCTRGQQGGAVEVVGAGQNIPAMRVGDSILFGSAVPPRSIQSFCVYMFQQQSAAPRDPKDQYQRLLSSSENLVKNADFESADNALASWDGIDPKRVSTESPGFFGQRCARVQIDKNPGRGWFGLRQDVPVAGARRYFISAWVKCKNVEGGNIALHVHWRTAKGELVKKGGMSGVGSGVTGSADWTLVSGVLEAPADASKLQLHLTTNTSGTIWYDGVVVAPVTTALAGSFQGKMSSDEGQLAIWPVDPVVKVFKEDLPPAKGSPARPAELRISAARNEAEPLQLALRASLGYKQVQAAVEPPVHASGAKLADATIGVVGYVPIDHKTNYYRSEAKDWQRRIPPHGASCDGWAGWWPDPLLPRDTFELVAQTTQPIWITVNVPKDAPAGDYRGKLKLSSGGEVIREVPFVVHVWDFALPDHGHFKAVYDVRAGAQWSAPGEDRQATWRKMSAFMARRRLSPDRISPEPSFKFENGKVIADFTEYDKAAEEYFNTLRHPHTYTPSIFYSFGWAHPPKKFLGIEPFEGKFPYEGVDRSKLRPEYRQAYQACLRTYLDHMKQKGWYDRVILYVSDEPHFWQGTTWGGRGSNPDVVPQMKAVCDMIHEVDRNIPIYSSTWWHVPAWDGFITAWGFGFHGIVAPEKIAEVKQAGAHVLWTVDGHMCTDTPYCAIERLLPHFCFKYGVEGYEFWGASWLTYDPYQFGWHRFIKQADKPGHDYWIRYPNGDGFLMYPGGPVGVDGPVSSVRLEEARDGVEDFEYLALLRDRIAQAKAAGRDVAAAARVLEAAQQLVTIPNAGGRYSSKLLPEPGVVMRVRDSVARAIESLR